MDKDIQSEFVELKRRVKALEYRYSHIDTLLESNTELLKRINASLVGDEFSHGWIRQIRNNKALSEENEKRLNQIKYWAAGASAGAILVAEAVMKFFGI